MVRVHALHSVRSKCALKNPRCNPAIGELLQYADSYLDACYEFPELTLGFLGFFFVEIFLNKPRRI